MRVPAVVRQQHLAERRERARHDIAPEAHVHVLRVHEVAQRAEQDPAVHPVRAAPGRVLSVHGADQRPPAVGVSGVQLLDRRRVQEDPDSRDFHAEMKAACDKHPEVADYPKLKTWCDEYFCNKHRSEQRGVGGVFFDDFAELGMVRSFEMLQSVGDAFLNAYMPIVHRRKDQPWTERERDFQLYRRGRYVEFNLVWDRGTLFGLQSGGRTESILMSLPPLVRWDYDWHPEPGSAEARLYDVFLRPQDWANHPA